MMQTEQKAKAPRSITKSGLYAARKALRRAGIKAVDRRTRLGRALREAHADLAAHLGTAPSVTQLRSIEAVLICDVLAQAGARAVEERGPIDLRKGTYRPIVRDLLSILERRRVLCADLGWQKAVPKRAGIMDIIKAHDAKAVSPASHGATPATSHADTTPLSRPATSDTDGGQTA